MEQNATLVTETEKPIGPFYAQAIADPESRGFAKSQIEAPHLCVDIPEGNSTISIRDVNGKKVTISIASYGDSNDGGIDIIQHKDS